MDMMILGGHFNLKSIKMFYIYLKNRTLFVILFSVSTLVFVESIMFFVYNEKPSITSIFIELPFFILGAWIYHYRMTKKIAAKKDA